MLPLMIFVYLLPIEKLITKEKEEIASNLYKSKIRAVALWCGLQRKYLYFWRTFNGKYEMLSKDFFQIIFF